jgi:hypothetical protein
MVWRGGVFSGVGVTVMGLVGVTMLHPQGSGDPDLPSAPEVAWSSSEDSSRVVHREGDPLWTIHMNMAHESHFWGERLRRPCWSAVNSRQPKQLVLSKARLTLVRLLLLAIKESFGEGAIVTSRGKARYTSKI